MRIGAVQNSNFFTLDVLSHKLFHLIHHPLRLGIVAGGLKHPHRLARALGGAQVLAQTFAVVADQFIGRVQNIAAAAVVFFQLDLVTHLELPHKIRHVAHPRTPKGVNALVIIPHGQHAAGGIETRVIHRAVRARAGQHLDPGILQLVGVLKLINQDVPKTSLVMLPNGVVVPQDLKTAQHQLPKIHHSLALTLVFIQLVNLNLFAGFIVSYLYGVGAQAVFFAAANEPLHLLGRKALVVNIELLVQPLDTGELVLRVQNLKTLGQIGQFEVGPQKPVAQPVKGANPHAPHIHRQHGREPGHHLLGRLIGEGHRHDAAGRYLPSLQEPGNAGGQYPRFARSGSRQNKRMLGRQAHSRTLFGVEILQERGALRAWLGIF